ncbi:MAG: glycosyltransferase [Armatimonadota bacterium]
MIEYPVISLHYLKALTDSTGIIQHGTHGIPNRKLGYTTDDNARALIVAVQAYESTKQREDLDLVITYLSFLHYAQGSNRKFRNVMSYQRVFMDTEGTEDCLGRVLWACGYAASSSLPERIKVVARNLFDDAIVWVGDLTSPRARAYSILGMYYYLKCNEDKNDLKQKINALADSLLSGFRSYSDSKWEWYEPYLTYGNSILPLGMMASAEVTGRRKYIDIAKRTVDFLTDNIVIDNRLDMVGNDGWYMKGGKKPTYDQQTIDAGYTVFMYDQAYKLFNENIYLDLMHISYSWFFGNNVSEVSIYEPETCGCYDAVTPWGVNNNQGAESIICILLSQNCIYESIKAYTTNKQVAGCVEGH